MRKLFPRFAIATATFVMSAIVLPGSAGADPAQVQFDANEASAGINRVINPSGIEAHAAVLAIRPDVGVPMLYVRICGDLTSSCEEYSHYLQPGEYFHGPTNNISRITATVQDLGVVDVDNYSLSEDSGGQPAFGQRDTILVQGLRALDARAARSGMAYGGRLGHWSVIAGVGINALMVSGVVWIKH